MITPDVFFFIFSSSIYFYHFMIPKTYRYIMFGLKQAQQVKKKTEKRAFLLSAVRHCAAILACHFKGMRAGRYVICTRKSAPCLRLHPYRESDRVNLQLISFYLDAYQNIYSQAAFCPKWKFSAEFSSQVATGVIREISSDKKRYPCCTENRQAVNC